MIFYPRCVFLFFVLADFKKNVDLFILFLASCLNHSFFFFKWASLVAQTVKNLPAMQDTRV